jgi:hypothetical protein
MFLSYWQVKYRSRGRWNSHVDYLNVDQPTFLRGRANGMMTVDYYPIRGDHYRRESAPAGFQQ